MPVSKRSARAAAPIICVDPGHPSETSDGTRGVTGLTENHVNWMVALRLRDRLRAQGYRVVMTKPSESQRVTNRERAQIANRSGAVLFLRLHCDAGSGSGSAVYYPDRQGRSQGKVGPTLAIISASAAAALIFYPAMRQSLRGALGVRGIHGDSATFVGKKQGALTGSVFTKTPALTVEMVVLGNPRDEKFAASVKGQERLAAALEAGVMAYAPHQARR